LRAPDRDTLDACGFVRAHTSIFDGSRIHQRAARKILFAVPM
jgi:hypothetical protein